MQFPSNKHAIVFNISYLKCVDIDRVHANLILTIPSPLLQTHLKNTIVIEKIDGIQYYPHDIKTQGNISISFTSNKQTLVLSIHVLQDSLSNFVFIQLPIVKSPQSFDFLPPKAGLGIHFPPSHFFNNEVSVYSNGIILLIYRPKYHN